MFDQLKAAGRRIQTKLLVLGKKRYLTYGRDLHVGAGTRLWAPDMLTIGNCVYIGKKVHIEANCDIGDYVLIANRVAIVGRHDHDFRAVGFPVRFAPWIASQRFESSCSPERAVIEDDVWIGYGAIILTGVKVGRGAIIGAGALVTKDIGSYAIALGAPARAVGIRFSSSGQIKRHENMIRTGRFRLSEKGYDACMIEPGMAGSFGDNNRLEK